MATKHWDRKLDIDVGGTHLVLDDMQVEFQVRQAELPSPDWAYIRITNLSDPTSNTVFQPVGTQVQINAGYHEGPFGLIYSGNTTQMRRGKLNGTDKYHDILCASGHQAYGYAVVQETLRAGSTAKDVIMAAVKPMLDLGVTLGYMDPSLSGKTFSRAQALNGMSREILNEIQETTDTSWTIFNNQFQIVKNSGAKPGVVEIGPETGMIGLPEQQLNGIVVRVLMNPSYQIAQQVHIDTSYIQKYLGIGGFYEAMNLNQNKGVLPGVSANGMYKIVRIDKDGSMRGQEWYTTLTCLALDDPGLASGAKGNTSLPKKSITEVDDGFGTGTSNPAP